MKPRGRHRGRLTEVAVLAAALGLLGVSTGVGEGDLVPRLVGRWAMLQVTSQIGAVPLVGERTRTTSSLLLLDVTQDDPTVSAVERTCSTSIDNGTSLVATEIPEAFLLSLPSVSWTATLDPNAEGFGFIRPWVTSVKGARLDDPENDPLPTQSDDPRVVDQDGDGKPGLTVHVSVMGLIEGDVYVVQRDRSRLVGTVVSADAAEGLLEWTSEQSTLGASSSFFLSGAAARPDPVAQHSYFRARRVAEGTTCAELQGLVETVFGD